MLERHRLAGIVIIFAGACAVPGEPDLGSTAGMSFEEYRALAQAHREPGGGYIVDWDLVLHNDEQLYAHWEQAQQGALTIYNVNGQDVVWNATQKKNITYCFGNTFTAAQRTAAETALKAAHQDGWELMADVKFVHVPAQDGANCTNQNTNVVFDVNRVNSNGDYTARAFFPNSPRNERSVLIDVTAFAPDLPVPLKNVLAHELGHTLGLRHEHIRAPGQPCAEDQNYRAITAYDSASVMHYPQCNGTSSDLAFTSMDRMGIAMIYGQPAQNAAPIAQLTEPSNGATVPPTFMVRTSLVDMDLIKGELYVDGVLHETLSTPPFQFQVANAALGAHTLKIKAIDAIGQSGEETINVTVEKGTGSGSENPAPGMTDDTAGNEVVGGCNAGGSAGLGLALALAGIRRRRRSR
ncbi:MAG: M57 family metalloprotease [Kofleriaceae bacterium]